MPKLGCPVSDNGIFTLCSQNMKPHVTAYHPTLVALGVSISQLVLVDEELEHSDTFKLLPFCVEHQRLVPYILPRLLLSANPHQPGE